MGAGPCATLPTWECHRALALSGYNQGRGISNTSLKSRNPNLPALPEQTRFSQTGPRTTPRLTRLHELRYLHATAEAHTPDRILSPRHTRGTENPGERAGPLRAEPGGPWASLPLIGTPPPGRGWQDLTPGRHPWKERAKRNHQGPERSLVPCHRKRMKSYIETCQPAMVHERVRFFLSHSSPWTSRAWVTRDIGREQFRRPEMQSVS